MKPILEWYKDLPEPYRSQAIENYDGKIEFSKSQVDAISNGFVWRTTPQGYLHWSRIIIRARRGEFDTDSRTGAKTGTI